MLSLRNTLKLMDRSGDFVVNIIALLWKWLITTSLLIFTSLLILFLGISEPTITEMMSYGIFEFREFLKSYSLIFAVLVAAFYLFALWLARSNLNCENQLINHNKEV